MNYFYKQTERNPDLFTVGYEDQKGKWYPHSDHSSRNEAFEEVARLNSGSVKEKYIMLFEDYEIWYRDFFDEAEVASVNAGVLVIIRTSDMHYMYQGSKIGDRSEDVWKPIEKR